MTSGPGMTTVTARRTNTGGNASCTVENLNLTLTKDGSGDGRDASLYMTPTGCTDKKIDGAKRLA